MRGSADEMNAFRELQSHLGSRWELADGQGPEPRDIVVVPSLSFDGIDTVSIDGVLHYEERMLFTLNLLRHPRARLVYVTSAPIHPAAMDYMLYYDSILTTLWGYTNHPKHRTPEQMLAELRDMRAHGITNTTVSESVAGDRPDGVHLDFTRIDQVMDLH